MNKENELDHILVVDQSPHLTNLTGELTAAAKRRRLPVAIDEIEIPHGFLDRVEEQKFALIILDVELVEQYKDITATVLELRRIGKKYKRSTPVILSVTETSLETAERLKARGLIAAYFKRSSNYSDVIAQAKVVLKTYKNALEEAQGWLAQAPELTEVEQEKFRALLSNSELVSLVRSGLRRLDQEIIYSEDTILLFGHSGVGKTTIMDRINNRFRQWLKTNFDTQVEYQLEEEILGISRKLSVKNPLYLKVAKQDRDDGNLISLPYVRATTSRDFRRKDGVPVEKQGHPHYYVFDDDLITSSQALASGKYLLVMKDWRDNRLVSYGIEVDEVRRCWRIKKAYEEVLGIRMPVVIAANILEPCLLRQALPFSTGAWLDLRRLASKTPSEILDARISGRQDIEEALKWLLDPDKAEGILVHLYRDRFPYPIIEHRFETEDEMVKEFYTYL